LWKKGDERIRNTEFWQLSTQTSLWKTVFSISKIVFCRFFSGYGEIQKSFPQLLQTLLTKNAQVFLDRHFKKIIAPQGLFQFSTVSAVPNITITT